MSNTRSVERVLLLLVKFFVSFVLLLIAVLHIFEIVRLDIETLVLLGFVILLWSTTSLRQNFSSIEFHGLKLEMKEEIKHIQENARIAGLVRTATFEDELGFAGGGSPEIYAEIAKEDPIAGIAVIRGELEIKLNELWDVVKAGGHGYLPPKNLIEFLTRQGILTREEASTIAQFTDSLNKMIHNPSLASSDDTNIILSLGIGIIRALDAKIKSIRSESDDAGGIG